MAFWSETQTADPKRQHRWLVQIADPLNNVGRFITWSAKSVQKPKMTIGEAEHKFINHTFYYPGGVTYDPITLTLVDPANPHATEALYTLIRASGYRLPGDIQQANIAADQPDVSTISKRKGVAQLGSVIIQQLNGDGNEVEKITLRNAWIKSVDFGGDLNYENEGLVEISLELRFDWFDLEVFQPSLSE